MQNTSCLIVFFVEYNACKSNPCRHGGTCNKRGRTYTCICKGNFDGKACRGESLFKYKRKSKLLV